MRSGGTPHFSSTALGSKRVEPLPSRPGVSTTTSPVTSCSRSLSAETTTTLRPFSTACRASVAIVSSAS
jgi:hypothetical protein